MDQHPPRRNTGPRMGWLIDNIDNSNRIAFEQGTLGGGEFTASRTDNRISTDASVRTCRFPPPPSQSLSFSLSFFHGCCISTAGKSGTLPGWPLRKNWCDHHCSNPDPCWRILFAACLSVSMGLESRSVGFLSLGLGQFRAWVWNAFILFLFSVFSP